MFGRLLAWLFQWWWQPKPESAFSPSCLPDDTIADMDFLESSFFKTQGPGVSLPTPEEVLHQWEIENPIERDRPVRFEHLSLLVKFGPDVNIAEAQCLWAIKKAFADRIPVPEVFGWRVRGNKTFIYMQLIRGKTLGERWDTLVESDKTAVCDQLYTMISSLRAMKQQQGNIFIGSISRKPLLDIVFDGSPKAGPFESVKTLHDYLSQLLRRNLDDSVEFTDPWRPYMPDQDEIVFTHCDLHRHNIIVSNTSPPTVLAIVDWGLSGWCPEYWEFSKACYTASYEDEWRTVWIPKFLTPRLTESEVFSEITMALGAF